MSYSPSSDETAGWFPVPGIPPTTYWHFGWCRPNYPPLAPPVTVLRCFLTDATVLCTNTPGTVPPLYRIPTVNTSYRVFSAAESNSGMVRFTIGAINSAAGGWINGPDANHQWSDALQVVVGYRVSPNLIPLQALSPCNPQYSSLPLHPVGTGTVNPEDPFEFLLSMPGDLPPGSYAILEVQSSWSESQVVNHQIIEFPQPLGTATGVRNTPAPKELALENYPNPFNPTTTIRYSLPKAANVTLAVYDVGGRLVRMLVNDVRKPAGVFEASWNGTDSTGNPVASGVYFYRLVAGSETLTRKAVLLK